MVAVAWSQLQQGWANLGLTSSSVQATAGIRAVQELVADIVSAWGEVSGTLAADFYNDLRDQADPGGVFEALILDPLNEPQVDRLVINALTPPEDEDPDLDGMLSGFEGSIQRLLRQAQRDTINESARLDPAPLRVRVARVPMGTETCAFCLVLASRGYVYRSLASAGGDGYDDRYHDFCDCEPDITWSGNPELPSGYDPGDLFERYETARRDAGTGDLRKVLKQLRLQEGIR